LRSILAAIGVFALSCSKLDNPFRFAAQAVLSMFSADAPFTRFSLCIDINFDRAINRYPNSVAL
jgi:hypothetical protein